MSPANLAGYLSSESTLHEPGSPGSIPDVALIKDIGVVLEDLLTSEVDMDAPEAV